MVTVWNTAKCNGNLDRMCPWESRPPDVADGGNSRNTGGWTNHCKFTAEEVRCWRSQRFLVLDLWFKVLNDGSGLPYMMGLC